ncbi:hypothetical protein [Lactiplantibacillus modestisalitolerans]|uniref:Uncharacterized protein n=1 Tax=Lactiplantibacillus modestisalitolerans TaxID=1457219 RepID=A0ABV5WVE5_9LACO|nr:hypothetical protein [Lactiplantibacillus modestisalitolerans]
MKYEYQFTFWRFDLSRIRDCFLTIDLSEEAANKLYKMYKIGNDGWNDQFAPIKVSDSRGIAVNSKFKLYSVLKIPE